MRAGTYEVLPTCDNPLGIKPKAYETPSPFELSSGELVRIDRYAQELRELLATYSPHEENIDSSNAQEQYRELNALNRGRHNELVEALEGPYTELAERVAEYAIDHQHQLEEVCRHVSLNEVPYALASLPPNLFDHRGGEPFLPSTDEESIQLVSEFMLFNRRLGSYEREYGHSFMGSVASRGFDVVVELRRRREHNDQTFATEEGRQNWRQYSQEFQREIREDLLGATLSKNAIYTAYRNNRLFSERGGFFEIADGNFESFWLANIESQSAFTSQIRVPIGLYGSEAAKDLTLATYLMMKLINEDVLFEQAVKRIAHNPETRSLFQHHLLRSRDASSRLGDPVEHGIKQTALEGVLSISATYAGIIEADGIPGYEDDLWGGLAETLDQQIATQITAHMPAGVIAAKTLWGRRIENMIITNGKRMRIRPEADAKLQIIRDRRTGMHHAAWSLHEETESDEPPVRFGLYCPFKGAAVREMAETLMVCRAIAHGSHAA